MPPSLSGIDEEDYILKGATNLQKKEAKERFIQELRKKKIYAVDKKDIVIYNIGWDNSLMSFSKRDSAKQIANLDGLAPDKNGNVNVCQNLLKDMDRCIKFIKNVDDVQIHFVVDAGLSTVAQFCDTVIWDSGKMSVIGDETDPVTGMPTGIKLYAKTGGFVARPFDPDGDTSAKNREISDYADVASWRKVVEKLVEISQDLRKDCFTIIDAPRNFTLDGAAKKIRPTAIDNTFDNLIAKKFRFISGINSSYAAGYYNWLRAIDKFSGKPMWYPPSTKLVGKYIYLDVINLPWLAPAGLSYGVIDDCYDLSHNPDYQEEDQIYSKSWNYIKQYPQDGIVVEGQRTLLSKESVFERVNVRLLFLDLERYTYRVAMTTKYKVNNTYTREQFVHTLKSKFEDYSLRGGIYEYYIKVDSTNNTPETIDANELRRRHFHQARKVG